MSPSDGATPYGWRPAICILLEEVACLTARLESWYGPWDEVPASRNPQDQRNVPAEELALARWEDLVGALQSVLAPSDTPTRTEGDPAPELSPPSMAIVSEGKKGRDSAAPKPMSAESRALAVALRHAQEGKPQVITQVAKEAGSAARAPPRHARDDPASLRPGVGSRQVRG